MNTKNKIIAGILATSALAFGVVHAQGPGCDSGGRPGLQRSSMPQRGMMDPAARVEQRLDRLKGELKLSSTQEPLWQAFAEKSKTEAGKGLQTMKDNAQSDRQLSAPERMAQMQSAMKQRVAAMESVNESFNRLYAGLTSEQKAAADKYFSAVGRHRHGPGRGGEEQGAPGKAEPRKG